MTSVLAGIAVCAAPAMASAATLANWHLDELSGSTMHDSSGNAYDGAISSGVRLGRAGYNGGKAYGFNGDGGRVSVPSRTSLSSGTGSFSVSLYFKSSTMPSPSVGDYDLIRKGVSTTSGGDWKMEILTSGSLFCHFRGSSTPVDLTGSTNVVTGSFHKLTCRYSSTGTQLIVDGTVQRSTSRRAGTVANSSPISLGAKSAAEDMTTGTIDEVLITKS